MSLYIVDIHGELEGDYEIIRKYEEPTTKNDLGVDCIDRAELLKAIDTWDKFGCDADTKLVPYQDHYIPYIHYDDVIKCIKGMPSVTPQEPCDKCEVGNPCLYCKHEFEPQESEEV